MPSSVSRQRLSGARTTSSTPDGVVVPAVDVGRQGVLAGVTARAVTAVVPQGDGLGEGDVQPQRAATTTPPEPPPVRG